MIDITIAVVSVPILTRSPAILTEVPQHHHPGGGAFSLLPNETR